MPLGLGPDSGPTDWWRVVSKPQLPLLATRTRHFPEEGSSRWAHTHWERFKRSAQDCRAFLQFSDGYTGTYLVSLNSKVNRLTPNDPYMGRTAPLTSKRCILYIYSTNIGTEYFKRAVYSPFSSLQNAVCFIMLTCLVPVLFSYTGCAKIKKNNSGAKGWTWIIQGVS